MKEVECPICGKKVKNLGAHNFQSHKDIETQPIEVDNHIKDKPLSELIDSIRQLLASYSNSLSVCTVEEGGRVSEVKITIGIRRR